MSFCDTSTCSSAAFRNSWCKGPKLDVSDLYTTINHEFALRVETRTQLAQQSVRLLLNKVAVFLKLSLSSRELHFANTRTRDSVTPTFRTSERDRQIWQCHRVWEPVDTFSGWHHEYIMRHPFNPHEVDSRDLIL